MKEKYIRLKALAFAGVMAATCVGITGCKNKSTSDTSSQAIVIEKSTKEFGVGEHIVSIPITDDIRLKTVQHEFHPGYEPVGISLTAYGRYTNTFGGGAIMFANTEEVECTSYSLGSDNNYIYSDFGTPVYGVKANNDSKESIKEFDVGEHIISVPMKIDNRTNQVNYEYHEGYEIVGVGTTSYGMYTNSFGGGVILYVNTTPVKCALQDEGYTSFGVPKESEKTKTLN